VNKGTYTDIFRRLRGAGRRKGREKRRTNSWFFLDDNDPAHLSVLVKDFLAKNNVTTLQHLPFLTFPGLKSAFLTLLTYLRMRRKSGKGFYKMASRNVSNTLTVAGRSVIAQGDYFEGNLRSFNDCTVLYFSKIK